MFKELRLLRSVRAKGRTDEDVFALANYLIRRKKPLRQIGPRDYVAAFGGIRVCDDIYGYEVTLGWDTYSALLDTNPSYYGLTEEMATVLYEAILTCIPGSIHFNKER